MNKFIEWSDLDLHKTTGKENLRCPSCDEVRTNKKDKSLKINHNNGMGKCFYCEVLTFRDDDKNDLKYVAQSDGGDIMFTSESGTKLNHEIEFIAFNILSAGEAIDQVQIQHAILKVPPKGAESVKMEILLIAAPGNETIKRF